mgnify:CR=1 FL=1
MKITIEDNLHPCPPTFSDLGVGALFLYTYTNSKSAYVGIKGPNDTLCQIGKYGTTSFLPWASIRGGVVVRKVRELVVR